MERHLEEYGDLLGLVVGAWGEGSEDLYNLVQVLAKTSVDTLGLARGQPATEANLGLVVGQIRRRLSVACVRANMTCLLYRMSLLGEGATRMMGRRQYQGWKDDNKRGEMQDQWLGRIRHHGVTHIGGFLLA